MLLVGLQLPVSAQLSEKKNKFTCMVFMLDMLPQIAMPTTGNDT